MIKRFLTRRDGFLSRRDSIALTAIEIISERAVFKACLER